MIAQAENLAESMRHIERSSPFLPNPIQNAKKRFDLTGLKSRGRLVENQDSRVSGERLGDLDDLLFSQRQIGSGDINRNRTSQPAECLRRSSLHFTLLEKCTVPRRLD